jgi:putative spermidine/putrescine transport system substrate-binding protein
MTELSRRSFLATGASIATVAFTGCGGAASSGGKGTKQELRVFVYAGGHEKTMREVFVPRFEAATGASISLHSGWWDLIAKLKSSPEGDPPFDLMITDATQGYPAAREGLFAKIDFTKVPSHKAMATAALNNWVYRDGLGLPYPDAVMTLAYNRNHVAKKQEVSLPAAWSDLLRPELVGKIGLYSSFYMSLYTFAAVLAATNGKPGTAQQLIASQTDEVFRFAREHRQAVKLWWPTSTDMILALNDQSVAAGNMHSPEYLQAVREKPDLAFVVPDQDRAMVQVFWAIPAGTKNQELAHQALELLFTDEVQWEFARRGMATARLDTAEKMAAEDPVWKSFYPHTAAQLNSLQYYPYDVYAKHWDEFADKWDRTILRGE